MHGIVPSLVAAAAVSLLAWAAILALPFRPWDLKPVAEEEPPAPAPPAWPSVAVLVPARNEASLLPRTLPALLAQDYPGPWRVILVDDRSSDGTGAIAAALSQPRLTVLSGRPLAPGWRGKAWALEQALQAAGREPDYYLLTDADILHRPGSLRQLVAESEAQGLALSSRMARLRCQGPAEKLLIPAFLYFFFLLYPPRLVNAPGSRAAAAAGGCLLVRRQALEAIGGFHAIRDRLIDDVSLARAVKGPGRPIRLAISGRDVASLRSHSLGSAWRMVRRTAFEELRYSWLRVALALLGLALLFLLPPLAPAAALALAATGETGPGTVALAVVGASSWLASAYSLLPTLRYFGLSRRRALAFPLAALLYAGMTLDSALRGSLGRGGDW